MLFRLQWKVNFLNSTDVVIPVLLWHCWFIVKLVSSQRFPWPNLCGCTFFIHDYVSQYKLIMVKYGMEDDITLVD